MGHNNKFKKTILVSGQIAPSHDSDVYPTHEDIFGKGGYSVVNDIAERDAISTERRKEGMAVYVKDSGGKEITPKVYVLEGGIDNTDWTEWPFGSGTGSIVVKDEGIVKTSSVSEFNFTGGGVTASASGNAVTVNIPDFIEPEIVTVKHTLGATELVGISEPSGGQPFELLPGLKESTHFYNIINIHCRFIPSGSAYNISGGDASVISMYYDQQDKTTGSIIPQGLLTVSGDDERYFAYSNPLADPQRDSNTLSSWNESGPFVISSSKSIDDVKGTAAGQLEIWVTYTLTKLT